MSNYTMSFDQKSLSEIAQFSGFSVFLSEQMSTAMSEGGNIIVQAAKDNADARFANPTGQLRDAIVPLLTSPYELQITVGVPYGARRDQGFSGADSLGRVYNDPPYYYATDALQSSQQQVLQLFDDAASNALAKLGGS